MPPRPLIVHYSRLSDEAKAAETLGSHESASTVQVDQLRFSPPLDDGGACGPESLVEAVNAGYGNTGTDAADMSPYQVALHGNEETSARSSRTRPLSA